MLFSFNNILLEIIPDIGKKSSCQKKLLKTKFTGSFYQFIKLKFNTIYTQYNRTVLMLVFFVCLSRCPVHISNGDTGHPCNECSFAGITGRSLLAFSSISAAKFTQHLCNILLFNLWQ